MRNYAVGGLKIVGLLGAAILFFMSVHNIGKTQLWMQPVHKIFYENTLLWSQPSCAKSLINYNLEVGPDKQCLVKEVKSWIHGKMYPSRPHQFTTNPPNTSGHSKIPAIVDGILGQKTGGFFIECGAFDGEVRSQTMFFELKRNWTGLLIEPNDDSFQKLLGKNRNAYSVNTCLSSGPRAERVNFHDLGTRSGVVGRGPYSPKGQTNDTLNTKICVPLYSLLLAMDNPIVDFFSLDVEGAEINILKSLPWDKIVIKVLSIEVKHIDRWAVKKIMNSQGYCLQKRAFGWLNIKKPAKPNLQDDIYVHQKFIQKCEEQ